MKNKSSYKKREPLKTNSLFVSLEFDKELFVSQQLGTYSIKVQWGNQNPPNFVDPTQNEVGALLNDFQRER